VVALGYTAVLLMAAQEHAYYGSFGYQVTSFFAPPARFGTPAELQALIDACHAHGLLVLFELVHAHASANVADGVNDFDGNSSGGYFLPGSDGWHAEWGTRMFDFSKLEVLRFLLSQVAYFATTYRCDGFRFDAVSAALYRHRSLHGKGTFRSYDDYYGEDSELDVHALTYFRLANLVAHELIHPPLVMIAEEHSGYPGLCAPVREGGVGFDYRQAMGQPPLWIKVLCKTSECGDVVQEAPAAEANMQRGAAAAGRLAATESSGAPRVVVAELARGLCERRPEERRIAYVECHDQSLVGGQSLAFRMMGADMFTGMSKLSAARPTIARGMALHKLSRLLAVSLGGEAYLNFIGNEFGHDGWIDFPREGNGQSYERARRRWDLADDPLLRYSELQAFDQALMRASDAWLAAPAPCGLRTDRAEDQRMRMPAEPHVRWCDCCEPRSLIWFRRGPRCWFGFNFHGTEAASIVQPLVAAQRYGAPQARVLLDSDAAWFGGKGRPTTASVVLRRPGNPPLPGECCTCAACTCVSHRNVTETRRTSALWALEVILPPLSSCVVELTGEH
jgi:1,4-alpha-glucan branching enzyme